MVTKGLSILNGDLVEPLIRKGQSRETGFGEDTGFDLEKSLKSPQGIGRRCPGKRRNPSSWITEGRDLGCVTKWVRSGLELKIINGI